MIAERYYNDVHYAWCSSFYRPPTGSLRGAMPPSAIPGEIYDVLWKDVTRGDRHSAWIDRNKVGILRGATAKLAAGVINAAQQADIASIVNAAQIQDFLPLVFVIPFSRVTQDVLLVPPAERAHPLSDEYRIEHLQRTKFDVIEPRRS